MSLDGSLSSISTPIFLTSLDASDLKAIEDAFHSNNRTHDNIFVTKAEFGDLVSSALTKGSLVDYYQLFDMIDISREGVIDWDRFSNYLLLEYYEREDRIKMTQVPQWQDVKKLTSPHKNAVCRILLNSSNINRYCTISKDGLVCIFNDQYEVKRVCQIHTNPEEIRSKDLWITDAATMPNINKIAFSTTSREIWIYDMSSKNDFVCQFKITGMKFIPLSMAYWSNKNNNKAALLTFGDTGGYVHALFFHNTTASLFEKPWKSEQSQDQCFHVNIENVMNEKYTSASYLQYKAHTAWVRQIMFIPLLDCFLSCSTTSNNSIVLAWLGKSRKDVRLTEFKIPLGINGFDYQESLNLIASAGINNHVCLWNPYVVSKPVGVLRGHMQVIVAVQFIHSKCQLISFSKDKVLRIWDVNLQICIQRLTGIFPKGPDVNILLFYDQQLSSLISSFNYQLQVLKMKQEVKHRVVSHDAPVTEVIYNDKYGHVISVDEASCITIWFLNTGQKVKHLPESHGEAEITTVCLDHSQTRILTAGTDGNVKIWDINGNCHHVLVVQDGNPCEISQILYLKRMIIAIGWSKVLCCFPIMQLKSYYVYPSDWKGKQEHFDDILAADFAEPRTLVTASYDGDIVFWNTNTQNSIRKIANDHKSRRNNRLPPLSPRLKSRQDKNDMSMSLRTSKSSTLRTESTFRTQRSVSPNIEENTSFVTVTSISFLKQRNTNDPRTADLYSCHSDGRIRFWNSLTCEKLGEFIAFDRFGSLVSCTDTRNVILGVGGETGIVKIWNIESYFVNKQKDLLGSRVEHSANQPLFMRSFTTHIDTITSIKFIEKDKKLLLLTSSSDCSVAIHALDRLIGVFGQTEHWNINDIPSINLSSWLLTQETEEEEEMEEEIAVVTETINIPTLNNSSNVDFNKQVTEEKPSEENIEILSTELSSVRKAVGEINKNKLGRGQTNSNSFVRNIGTKQNCSYRSLNTKQMDDIGGLEKPEFVLHPEKYFLQRQNSDNTSFNMEDTPNDDLILKHDEKSIFPKYILDMDLKMRTAHKIMNTNKPPLFSKVSSINRGFKTQGIRPKYTARNSILPNIDNIIEK